MHTIDSAIRKALDSRFSGENFLIVHFRFNIHTTFPESGSRKRFHVTEMRAIDSSHKITPIWVLFRKKHFRVQNSCEKSQNFMINPILFFKLLFFEKFSPLMPLFLSEMPFLINYSWPPWLCCDIYIFFMYYEYCAYSHKSKSHRHNSQIHINHKIGITCSQNLKLLC